MPKQTAAEKRAAEYPHVQGRATFNEARTHRYVLTRSWDAPDGVRAGTLVVIGLNPSTADADTDDRTIAKCMKFAKRLGFNRLVMLNVFAFMATNPVELLTAKDPVGPRNDEFIRDQVVTADLILAAWGSNKMVVDTNRIEALLDGPLAGQQDKLHALKILESGWPGHPLYLPDDSPLVPYWPSMDAVRTAQRLQRVVAGTPEDA